MQKLTRAGRSGSGCEKLKALALLPRANTLTRLCISRSKKNGGVKSSFSRTFTSFRGAVGGKVIQQGGGDKVDKKTKNKPVYDSTDKHKSQPPVFQECVTRRFTGVSPLPSPPPPPPSPLRPVLRKRQFSLTANVRRQEAILHSEFHNESPGRL